MILSASLASSVLLAQDSAPAESAATLESTVVEATPTPKPKPAPRPATRRAPDPAPAPAPAPLVLNDLRPEPSVVPSVSTAATKLDTPLIETPQSVSVVTREEMAMRGARNVTEALAYTAGVYSGVNGIEPRFDSLSIRGFDARSGGNSSYLDGLRTPQSAHLAISAIDAFGFESVEVLKGPSSVLFGQIAPGGFVNRTSKRPLDHSRNEIGVEYFNYGSGNEAGRITFDTTGPIGGASQYSYDGGGKSGKGGKQLIESGPAASYRFAGFYQDGETQIDHVDHERIFLAPSVTFHLGEDTDLTVHATYQRDEGGYGYQFIPMGLSYLPNPFGHIGNNVFLGEPDFNQYDRTQFYVGYEFDHRFDEVWSLSHRFRYSHVDAVYKSVGAAGMLPDFRTVNRNAGGSNGDTDAIQFDTRLVAEFATGAAEHTALLGFDYLKQESRYETYGWYAIPATIDAFNLNYAGTASFINLPYDYQVTDGINDPEQVGLYAQDQIALGNWRASIGGRYDWSDGFDSSVWNGVTSSTTTKAEAFTGRAGLLYLFDNGIAPYASYATSFEPVGGSDFFGAPFDPTTGQQTEFGVKYEPKSFKGLLTASWFDLTQQNVLTPDPAPGHAGFSVQTGEISVQGFEFEAKAELAEGLMAIGSLTLLDTEIAKTNRAAELGREVAWVPSEMASAWLDYTFPEGPLHGFGIGAGVRHVSDRFGDNANTVHLPSYTLFDAALRYDLGALSPEFEGARVSVNVSNLKDDLHISNAFGQVANYGYGRIVTVKMTYEW